VQGADRPVLIEQINLVIARRENLSADAVGLVGGEINDQRRNFFSSVSVGIESIIRVQANGATQFERMLKRAMSSAMPRDSPTMPSFAAM